MILWIPRSSRGLIITHKLFYARNRITSILNKNRAITADTALRLAQYFGTTSEFWMNLQVAYDLKVAKKKVGKKIEKEVDARKVA